MRNRPLTSAEFVRFVMALCTWDFFGQEPAELNNLIDQHSSASQRSASAELADRRPSSPLFSESGRAATREPCARWRGIGAQFLFRVAVLCLGDLNMYLSIPIDVYSSPFSHESPASLCFVQLASARLDRIGLFFYYFWRAAARSTLY